MAPKAKMIEKNLDLEFQQLKTEVSRIAEAGKYNGIQINGKTAVATYDTLSHKIVYSQADGTDARTMEINFRDGNTAKNNVEYAFESSAANGSVGDYIFTEDGKSLLYIAQKAYAGISAQRTLMKLDIESNTLSQLNLASAGGTSATTQARLIMDDQGRIWVSDPSTNANVEKKNFNVKLLNVDDMTLDAGGTGVSNQWSGSISLASSFSNFSINGDYAYYIERSAAGAPLRYVKRSLFDTTDKTILINDLSGSTYDFEAGETYTISQDGQYIVFEDEDNANTGTMVVINTRTSEKSTFRAGTRTNSLTSMSFDANNNLYWTDTGATADDNAVKRAKISYGDTPEIYDVEVLRTTTAGRLGSFNSAQAGLGMGLSVQGGSPTASYQFHVGAEAGMDVDFESADIRLTKLGLSHLGVLNISDAQESIANVSKAVGKVANQRAVIGSQVSRLQFIFSANASFANNLSQAESRIRDVDIASETSRLTRAQIASQTSVSILAQSNQAQQNILRLLQ